MTQCQSCGSQDCLEFLDLGNQPICNRFLDSESEFVGEPHHPLRLVFCRNCTLVQLSTVPPGSVVFGDQFNYLSGTTPDVVRYFRDLAKTLTKRFALGKGDYVVDIGSNDGSLLAAFRNTGVEVLGVEPTPKPCEVAAKKGIPTINLRFEDAIHDVLERTDGRIRLITALNVLAHTDTVHDFLRGIAEILRFNNACFVGQSHYFPMLVDGCEFDTVYHEHARYYTLTSLESLLGFHGLHIFDAEISKFYGGSFVAYADSNPGIPQTPRLQEMRLSEARFHDEQLYRDFAQRVAESKESLRSLLTSLKSKGKRIVGIGAPMKSSTLLNYCNIDSLTLDYLTEVNPLKIGTFSPGTHIKVVNEDEVFSNQPDVGLILSWNVADRIMGNLKSKGFRGSFIVPIPTARLVQ